MHGRVDRWLACSLEGPRAAGAPELACVLRAAGIAEAVVERFDSPAAAYLSARARAGRDDRIVAFGSFLTVASVLRAIEAAG
jgi:dihydrofolate synthase/folylpolyglutamate synthase